MQKLVHMLMKTGMVVNLESKTRMNLPNKPVIAYTLFRYKRSRTVTWHSSGGINLYQIDFIIQKWHHLSIKGLRTRAFPGVDINSEHELLLMTMQLKLRVQKRHLFDIIY